MKCGLAEGELSSKCFLEYTVFPPLDEYSDLSVPLFRHGMNNNKAGTIREGKILGGMYKSLYLNLFDLVFWREDSQDSIRLLCCVLLFSGQAGDAQKSWRFPV